MCVRIQHLQPLTRPACKSWRLLQKLSGQSFVVQLYHSNIVLWHGWRCAEPPSSWCAEQFTEALHYWQAHSQALPVAADPTAAADEPAGPTAPALALRYADAAVAVTPRGQATISPALLARIMLVAHHPVISKTQRLPQAAWTLVKRKIFKLGSLFDGEHAEPFPA